ncbi:DUF2515 family protein [Bacillus sp. SCS-153A]|uniref:DUF2515 family protein n=1 Tax=Rossellomorea sedimentorum TaxID=3115294 RepID=UPI003905CBB2
MVVSFIQNLLAPKEKFIPLLPKTEIQKIKNLIMNTSHTALVILSDERLIIEEIKSETERKNKNNVTRTKAYLDYYKTTQEIEWAFLAHMVSRNAGYHMTDLKGEILPSFLDEDTAKNFFLFLEKANAFIFHDAFPQLLLYKKSIEKKKPLFHLLPAFGVSKAMSVFWERFWNDGDKRVLALGLIINEQSMLQTRLVAQIQEDYVYEKFLFYLQDRLEWTTVFFPYKKSKQTGGPYLLAGTTISYFENTEERINIGKKLYSILFLKQPIYRSAFHYAMNTPHTGSRSDYWPKSYSHEKTAKKIFSPQLESVWHSIDHSFSYEDWVKSDTIHYIDVLETLPVTVHFDVTPRASLIVKLSSDYKSLST